MGEAKTPHVPAPNAPLQYPALRAPSLDECKKSHFRSVSNGTTDSTAASTSDENEDPRFEVVGEALPQPQPTLVLNLLEGLGIWSAGSAGHYNGCCKPCAFIWKEEGCKDGINCTFCHLCTPDEKKRRKKEKLAWRKNVRFARQQAAVLGLGVPPVRDAVCWCA